MRSFYRCFSIKQGQKCFFDYSLVAEITGMHKKKKMYLPLNSLFVCLAILRIFTHSFWQSSGLRFIAFWLFKAWTSIFQTRLFLYIFLFRWIVFFSQPHRVFLTQYNDVFDVWGIFSKTSGLCFLIDFKMSIFLFLALVWSDNGYVPMVYCDVVLLKIYRANSLHKDHLEN